MASVVLLLAALPGSVSAQAAPNEKLAQVISKLGSCVRTFAPAAEAAGMRNSSNAINFFLKICITLPQGFADAGEALPGALSSSDLADVGAVPLAYFGASPARSGPASPSKRARAETARFSRRSSRQPGCRLDPQML
jgi:hypothetical protein